MLNRRCFIVGACCSAQAALLPASGSASEKLSFKCSTVNTLKPGETEDTLPVTVYSDTDDQLKFKAYQEDLDVTPFGAAYVKSRWHLSDGLTPGTGKITLGVFFLNGSNDQQELVKSATAGWTSGPLGKIFALDFSVTQQKSHIRIAFDGGDGNWSFIGRQSNNVQKNLKTMNIESLEDFIVQHEFGHTWCLQHEHQFPGAIHWNQPQVIADMEAEQGWSASMTKAQMLASLDKAAVCIGDPHFNKDSTMLYPIRQSWTTDGFSSDWNKRISDGDVRCLAGVYNFKI
jgi:serralysin